MIVVYSNTLEIVLTDELFLFFVEFSEFFHDITSIWFFMKNMFLQCIEL